MAATFLTQRGWILGGFVSEYLMTIRPITTLKLVQQAYAVASPGEKQQITAFVKANSDAGIGSYWFLAKAENHDTGRVFLTAGYSISGPGIILKQLRQVVRS